jgi:hypothetical protein
MREVWYPIRDRDGRIGYAIDFAKPSPFLQMIVDEAMLKRWIKGPDDAHDSRRPVPLT